MKRQFVQKAAWWLAIAGLVSMESAGATEFRDTKQMQDFLKGFLNPKLVPDVDFEC